MLIFADAVVVVHDVQVYIPVIPTCGVWVVGR